MNLVFLRKQLPTAIFLVLLPSIQGCAWQTEALMTGEYTYEVSTNASALRGAQAGAREMALEEANKKCNELGRQIEVVDFKSSQHVFPAYGDATLKFKCVKKVEI